MHKYFISLFIFLVYLTTNSYAQQIPTCTDAYVHDKVVSNNNMYEQQGYKLHFTRQMHILSGGFQPVTVSLKAGQYYLINFVPFLDATNLKLAILDKDNKTIVNKKGKKNTILTHSFVAEYTGDYYIVVSQKMRKVKEICGGVSVFTKQ